MSEKRKNTDGNAITSQIIFNRDVWLIKAKEREVRALSEHLRSKAPKKEKK